MVLIFQTLLEMSLNILPLKGQNLHLLCLASFNVVSVMNHIHFKLHLTWLIVYFLKNVMHHLELQSQPQLVLIKCAGSIIWLSYKFSFS